MRRLVWALLPIPLAPATAWASRIMNVLDTGLYEHDLTIVPRAGAMTGSELAGYGLRIAAARGSSGDFDPFGDYNLLFGAAKMGLRNVDIPVRCPHRVCGRANIDCRRHGPLLLRMVVIPGRRLKSA